MVDLSRQEHLRIVPDTRLKPCLGKTMLPDTLISNLTKQRQLMNTLSWSVNMCGRGGQHEGKKPHKEPPAKPTIMDIKKKFRLPSAPVL